MKTVLVVVGAFPLLLLVGVLLRFITPDTTVGGIEVLFALALVPGVVENYRQKKGWSQETAVMTTSGLLAVGVVFLLVNLPVSALMMFFNGVMWFLLTVQAFLYTPLEISNEDLARIVKQLRGD